MEQTCTQTKQEIAVSPSPATGGQKRPLSTLHRLQKAVGNQAIQQFIQAKLAVSQPGDFHEREADRVAHIVLTGDTVPFIHPLHSGHTQGKCACGGSIGPEGMCGACRRRVSGQRKAQNEANTTINNPTTQSLSTTAQTLDRTTQQFVETRFGANFGQVRIHTDNDAARAARQVNARAFTIGNHIIFNHGEYAPETTRGRYLLAHELTHVLQQNGSRAAQTTPARMILQRQPDGEPKNTNTDTDKAETKTDAQTIQEAVNDGDYEKAFKYLNGQSMAMMLRTLSSGLAVTLHVHRQEAGDANLPRIDVALSAVMFGKVFNTLPGWTSLPDDQKQTVCAFLKERRTPKPKPPGFVDTLVLDSGRKWRYVVYENRVQLHFTPQDDPILRVGSIPWVTNNPGNLTVDPRERDEENKPLPPATKTPWNLPGAVGRSYYETAKYKYPIYETYEQGMDAIFLYLQQVYGTRSTEDAIRSYVSKVGIVPSMLKKKTKELFPEKSWETLTEEERVKVKEAGVQAYVKTIQDRLATQVGEERAKALMTTKVSDVSEKTVQTTVTAGIMEAEGSEVLPGVIFTCRGFTPPDITAYLNSLRPKLKGSEAGINAGLEKIRTKLEAIITDLTGSAAAENTLRQHLACPDKDDACIGLSEKGK